MKAKENDSFVRIINNLVDKPYNICFDPDENDSDSNIIYTNDNKEKNKDIIELNEESEVIELNEDEDENIMKIDDDEGVIQTDEKVMKLGANGKNERGGGEQNKIDKKAKKKALKRMRNKKRRFKKRQEKREKIFSEKYENLSEQFIKRTLINNDKEMHSYLFEYYLKQINDLNNKISSIRRNQWNIEDINIELIFYKERRREIIKEMIDVFKYYIRDDDFENKINNLARKPKKVIRKLNKPDNFEHIKKFSFAENKKIIKSQKPELTNKIEINAEIKKSIKEKKIAAGSSKNN